MRIKLMVMKYQILFLPPIVWRLCLAGALSTCLITCWESNTITAIQKNVAYLTKEK